MEVLGLQYNINKIEACFNMGSICGFKCCNHTHNKHSHFIMMYPGEYDSSQLPKVHIEILEERYGALIGRCLHSISERKDCDGNNKFKPLDCYSYPFFPSIKNGQLILKVDSVRCPLSRENIQTHYWQVMKVWQELIKDNKIYNCIEKFEVKYYTEFLI